MKSRRPIYWHQGLFLQPQHYQQLEQYFHSLLYPVNTYNQPSRWGLVRSEIQQEALNNRIFDMDKAELLFQDGSWVEFPGNAFLQSRSFEQAWIDDEKPFTVYLGMRKFDPAANNAQVFQEKEQLGEYASRLVVAEDPEVCSDAYAGGPKAYIRKMSYLLKIFWEDEVEQLPNYHLLPVARLAREGQEVVLDKDFIPPVLCLSGSDTLFKVIKNIRDQIASRCRQLDEFKSPKEIQTTGFDNEYMVYLLALRSLNRFAPVLYHLLEFKEVHPWTIYGLLRQIIGELSTFSNRINAFGETSENISLLPAYDHGRLSECFNQAGTLISELLNEIIIGPEHVIRLTRVEDGFQGEVPPKALDRRNVFYLIIRSEQAEASILRAVSNIAKLCSIEQMPTLAARALPGVPLEQSKVPPPGLPRRPNSYYFRIDREHNLWEFVQRHQNIQLYWEAAPEDMQVEVVILRKE
ncbi:MAG: type VI secretion system baseplate subunit TssK [Desulfohalobiaceae bacterium]|nr:type VI secretion system baseplate subunit TssK [Desulfohalobiaceae bacterium]